MSDQLLLDDIKSWLASHRGRAAAAPRAVLLAHLKSLGHSVGDRQLRAAYASIDNLGSCCAGIFLIVTADDRRVSERGLHSHAMSELVRERRIKDGVPCGQGNLWEEAK